MLKKKYVSALCASVLSIIFFACKEDIGNVGLNVQPEDELLNTTLDTNTIIVAYSAKNDSVITSNTAMNLLGDIGDPVFGRTQAAICTQFRLSGSQVKFGEDSIVDSLILNLAYGGYYGDTMQSLRIRVYELNEDLKYSELYYGNSTIRHDPELLADVQIQPMPNTLKDTSTSVAYMSIPLSKDFAERKFLSKSGKSELENDANFVNYFKGLYIEAEAVSSNGCMLSINLLHANSSMILYYSNKEKSNQLFRFNINDSCARFSSINHFDYAGADPNLLAQLSGNYSSAEETLYGQSAGGIKTVITFPHLKAMFADKQVVVHKAELIVTRKEDNLPNYTPPATLSLSYDHSSDRNLALLDAAFGSIYFGGTYNEITKQYAFRITKYIQTLINEEGTEDYKLNLMVTPATYLSRSMYYGTNPAEVDKRIKLRIYYTLINK